MQRAVAVDPELALAIDEEAYSPPVIENRAGATVFARFVRARIAKVDLNHHSPPLVGGAGRGIQWVGGHEVLFAPCHFPSFRHVSRMRS